MAWKPKGDTSSLYHLFFAAPEISAKSIFYTPITSLQTHFWNKRSAWDVENRSLFTCLDWEGSDSASEGFQLQGTNGSGGQIRFQRFGSGAGTLFTMNYAPDAGWKPVYARWTNASHVLRIGSTESTSGATIADSFALDNNASMYWWGDGRSASYSYLAEITVWINQPSFDSTIRGALETEHWSRVHGVPQPDFYVPMLDHHEQVINTGGRFGIAWNRSYLGSGAEAHIDPTDHPPIITPNGFRMSHRMVSRRKRDVPSYVMLGESAGGGSNIVPILNSYQRRRVA